MRALPLAALLLCTGCATRQSVTLLPGEPGHPVGAVAVIDEDDRDLGQLDAGNSRAALGAGRVRPRPVAAATVARRYGDLVAALPPPPRSFTLRFDVGDATPSDDQEATLRALFDEARSRPGAEVQVVGHTDSLDSDAVNDRLSRRRAEEVRLFLIRRGLAVDQVRATWRGERDLLVPTADGTANAQNRRVEVIVR